MNSPSQSLSRQIAEQHFMLRGQSVDTNITPLPNPSSVHAIMNDLTEIILLREGPQQAVDVEQLSLHIDAILSRVRLLLLEQVSRELGTADAEGPTDALLARLPVIIARVRGDIDAVLVNDPAARGTDYVRLTYPGVWAIVVYRIAHETRNLGLHLIARLMAEHAHEHTGIDIHPGARIGERFCIDHGTGIVIGETTSIGSEVSLYQGVTLGAQSFPRREDGSFDTERKRHPTIGNNVKIYAHAVIVGSAKVEDGSIVGSGTRLALQGDIPAGTKVLPPLQELRLSGPNIGNDISPSS